jgi:hypothetical protein
LVWHPELFKKGKVSRQKKILFLGGIRTEGIHFWTMKYPDSFTAWNMNQDLSFVQSCFIEKPEDLNSQLLVHGGRETSTIEWEEKAKGKN